MLSVVWRQQAFNDKLLEHCAELSEVRPFGVGQFTLGVHVAPRFRISSSPLSSSFAGLMFASLSDGARLADGQTPRTTEPAWWRAQRATYDETAGETGRALLDAFSVTAHADNEDAHDQPPSIPAAERAGWRCTARGTADSERATRGSLRGDTRSTMTRACLCNAPAGIRPLASSLRTSCRSSRLDLELACALAQLRG